jgi:epoxyqueuosine reductase
MAPRRRAEESAEERIKAEALSLGFTAVGIARAEKLEREADRLRAWLDSAYHATMEWMARRYAERTDPERVLPGVRSVIVVAMNYYHPAEHARGTGRISRYAWGDDYHELLGAPLRTLGEWLEREFPGARAKTYADTGPVMEKAWAERAGIGWIGKHTNLITRERGSWVFLGVLLTTLELTQDAPATDHCGTCTLCLEACPTGAIVDPYVLDARRCISYLTIEHRGAIPAEFEDALDGWIFGCDTCQDVCPWNERFAEPCGREECAPREGLLEPPLAAWAGLTDEEFSRLFEGSAIRRARPEGFRRNVRAVLSGPGA